MSNIEKYEVAKDLVLSSEYDFKKLADAHGAVEWEKEASFAVQALKANNYLCGIAYSNPDSLKMAVVNVAAVGLTLNPVRALAYLVPRDGRVSLDVSYRGYVQLAIDSGGIVWAKAEVVHEKDSFEYNGMGKEPSHRFNPFTDRGAPVGAYCVAKTPDGDYLTEMMNIEDIFDIRNRSKAWQSYKKKGSSCPWVTDESEMIKKTIIRRGYKSWPIPSETSIKLDKAMEVTFDDHEIDVSPLSSEKIELLDACSNKLELLEKKADDAKFITYLSRLFSRKVESIDSLTDYELRKLSSLLDQMVAAKKPKEPKEVELELEEIEEDDSFMDEPEPTWEIGMEQEEIRQEIEKGKS